MTIHIGRVEIRVPNARQHTAAQSVASGLAKHLEREAGKPTKSTGGNDRLADRSIEAGEDEVEIERMFIDLPEGEIPDVGEELARQVVSRLSEILERI